MSLDLTLNRGFARALGTDPGPEIETYVREGRGPLPGTAHLLAWDANSIHGYVFGTTNATAIRGASHVLAEIDRDLREGDVLGLRPEQILYAGGGSGLAVVAEAEVGRVQEKLHELFAERTAIATCTAADVPLVVDGDGFAERKKAVDQEVSHRRGLVGPSAEPYVPFFAERCVVCGRRAAAVEQRRYSGPRFECEPCRQAIETGKQTRHDASEAVDFQEVSDRGEGGFYAVVYADGNGIGKLISTLKSPLEYRTFSVAVTRVVESAFREARKKHDLHEEKGNGYGYQLPICAGDDLVAILPGALAVPFARDLLREIELQAVDDPDLPGLLQGREDVEIGAAAGVAIGQIKFPVRHLLDEARALLKSAKRRVYKEKVRSVLDFSVITDGSPRCDPDARDSGETFRQTGRPYALDEMDRFSERFETIRGERKVGKSQLYILRDHAGQGLPQLRSHVLYQVGRREAWRQLVNDLAGADVTRDKEACMEQIVPLYGGRRTFDVADMIELYTHWGRAEA